MFSHMSNSINLVHFISTETLLSSLLVHVCILDGLNQFSERFQILEILIRTMQSSSGFPMFTDNLLFRATKFQNFTKRKHFTRKKSLKMVLSFYIFIISYINRNFYALGRVRKIFEIFGCFAL